MIRGGPSVVTNGLVLSYDPANIKSFRGEPTTNAVRNASDLSGEAYASNDPWTNLNVLSRSYNASIKTPIGTGATLVWESGVGGYHYFSCYGGRPGGNEGQHCLSAYIYPLTNSINNFTMGCLGDSSNLITFDLSSSVITYGGGISNRNAFIQQVDDWPGWLRVGGNFEGRGGGWVGAFGLTIQSTYTGSVGGRSFYIAGHQYEYNQFSASTLFIGAQQTRGRSVETGGGFIDLSGNNYNGYLISGSSLSGSMYWYPNKGYMILGTNNNDISSSNIDLSNTNVITMDFWCKIPTYSMVPNGGSGIAEISTNFNNSIVGCLVGYSDDSNAAFSDTYPIVTCIKGNVGYNIVAYTASIVSDSNWHHWSCIFDKSMTNGTESYLSNFKLYNRRLTDVEIKQNYNATKGRFNIV